jgi:hypothetical protein
VAPKVTASARPALGPRASRPPGRALASEWQERTVDRGPGLRRGGGTHVFPDPPAQRDGASWPTLPMAEAYASAIPHPEGSRTGRGPQGHGQPPHRAWAGRFSPAGSGGDLWSAWRHRCAGHWRARAGGNDGRFPDPPEPCAVALRGPSPMAEADASGTFRRIVQERPWPPRPRPAPAPPLGRGLFVRRARRWPLNYGNGLLIRAPACAGAGERDAFPDPTRTERGGASWPTLSHGRGQRLCHAPPDRPGPAVVPKDSARPALLGRALASVLADEPTYRAPPRTGGAARHGFRAGRFALYPCCVGVMMPNAAPVGSVMMAMSPTSGTLNTSFITFPPAARVAATAAFTSSTAI